MSEHIYHATATLAELGLAMSIGSITNILPQPKISDPLARETTKQRIAQNDGKIAIFFYQVGIWATDFLYNFQSKIPVLIFLIQLAVLGGMAFSPDTQIAAVSLFFVALIGLLIMMLFVYVNRETFKKTNERPLVEPSN